MLVEAQGILSIVEGITQLSEGEEIVEAIVNVVRDVQQLLDACRLKHIRGRPQIPISKDQLVALLELQFSNRDIANLLGDSSKLFFLKLTSL